MSDYLNALKNYQGQIDADGVYVGVPRQELERAVEEIEQLREAQRWIPVSERLPEKGESVETWNGAHRAFDTYDPDMLPNQSGWDNVRLANYLMENENERMKEPTHWKYKTQPPKDTGV